MDANIKVLIVDDHKLISEAWSSLLKDAPDIQVVGTADNVDDAYDMSLQHKPEIVLMDINLGAGSGFDATEKINNSLPKTRVIGLSLHDDITYVKKFLSIGAKGYLTKNTSKSELFSWKIVNGTSLLNVIVALHMSFNLIDFAGTCPSVLTSN